MRRAATTPGMRRLRLALLIAIGGVLGGVSGLFLLGRASRPPAETVAAGEAASPAARPVVGDVAVLSEGFDYEQQVGGKPVFRLQGDRFTTDREGRVALEGVRLVLYREGEPYEVRSHTAIYDPETKDAELAGEVRVSGGGGWELSSARLDLDGETSTIVSRGGRVSFRRGDELTGSARRLRYLMEDQVLVLEGKVEVAGEREGDGRALGLDAETVRWERDGATVAAEGGVRLVSDGDVVEAQRLDARLRPGGAELETATATGEVRGRLGTADEGGLAFTADRAQVDFDSATGAASGVLLADERQAQFAEVVWAPQEGGRRRLLAPLVEIGLDDGRAREAVGTGGVTLRERSAEGGERQAVAEQMTATFGDDGELESARLAGKVRMTDATWTIAGDEADVTAGGSAGVVRGRPAHAVGERGEMTAPTMRFDRAASRLDAAPDVRVTFRPEASPMAAGERGSGDAPVHVQAREATFLDSPRRFDLRGEVRAAQGESLLFADRLEGDEERSLAIASGSVRSQWTDRADEAAGSAAAVVTVISAERCEYRRREGVATYTGDVVARQQRREIRGDQIVVELDEGGAARRMLATGEVSIEDRQTGRSVSGASADYDLRAGEALVVGQPVVLRDESGTVLRGRRALFDERTGTSRLVSEGS